MSLVKTLFWFVRTRLMSDAQKDLEIIALRSQLAVFQQQLINHKRPKACLSNSFRRLWIWISKHLPNWKSALIIVKPETVIRWHKRAFNSIGNANLAANNLKLPRKSSTERQTQS